MWWYQYGAHKAAVVGLRVRNDDVVDGGWVDFALQGVHIQLPELLVRGINQRHLVRAAYDV